MWHSDDDPIYPSRHYHVLGRLSRSQQAVVYQAYRGDLAHPPRFIENYVVVKALYGAAAQNIQQQKNLLSTLNHYAIPRLLDSLEEHGRPYLVFEYVSGIDMATENFRRMKGVTTRKIIEWAVDLCSALGYLHRRQPTPILHNYLCPAHVIIDHKGNANLIGFRLAEPYVEGQTYRLRGSASYEAPERVDWEASSRSDIYSLGAILYELLTHDDPPYAPPMRPRNRRVPIPVLNSNVPHDLVEIVEKALEFYPEDRYQNVDEMKLALLSLLK